jgi:hypothetical protein
MQGAQRDASVLRRMPMRARSRNEQVARSGLSGFAGPRWCAFDAVGLWPTAVERESHSATPTNRPG